MGIYTNSAHTEAVFYKSSGSVADLIRLGKMTEADVATLEPYVEPLPTAKQRRDDALAALSYEFADGGVVQTSPVARGQAPSDEANIRNAIEFMGKHDELQVMPWVMADNTKRDLTVDELQEALDGSQLSGVQIWAEYDPEG